MQNTVKGKSSSNEDGAMICSPMQPERVGIMRFLTALQCTILKYNKVVYKYVQLVLVPCIVQQCALVHQTSRAEGMDFPIPEFWWSTNIPSSLTHTLVMMRECSMYRCTAMFSVM